MADLIDRQAAIDEIEERKNANGYRNVAVISELNRLEGYIMRLPSAQPEIAYQNCSDALLKMWMDNVLTDGEYNRIMDKLNKFDAERRANE